MVLRPASADESLHAPGDGDGWHEVFELGFAVPDGSIAGAVVLTIVPAQQRSWFWAAVVGRGRPLVAVYEDDAPLPRRNAVELRTSGLWVDVEVEVPFDHVTLGVESFGLVFDDPDEVLGAARGHRTPVGFDLEWESDPATVRAAAGGFDVPCRVHGDVLLGQEIVALDTAGWRCRRWGSAGVQASFERRVRVDGTAVTFREPTPSAGQDHAADVIGRAPVVVPALVSGRAPVVLDRTLAHDPADSTVVWTTVAR